MLDWWIVLSGGSMARLRRLRLRARLFPRSRVLRARRRRSKIRALHGSRSRRVADSVRQFSCVSRKTRNPIGARSNWEARARLLSANWRLGKFEFFRDSNANTTCACRRIHVLRSRYLWMSGCTATSLADDGIARVRDRDRVHKFNAVHSVPF